MIKYNDVKNISTEEYFNNNQFSIDAFNKKYKLTSDETYVQALKRVCDAIASVEQTPELQKYWSERWFDEIYNDWWHPAGSIMQGAGSGKKISLANCTTLSMGGLDDNKEWDNLESIIKNTGYTLAKTAARRQGLGTDGSRLRPRGSEILNSAVESSGVVHWFRWLDSMANFVGQKGRIPAILLSLNIKHPDIEEFITVKSDYTKIQNANISVQITNNFYKAIEENGDWELYFKIPKIKKGDKIYLDVHSTDMSCQYDEQTKSWYTIATHDKKEEVIKKTVKAKKLLELIAKNMTENAEPGIQNIDIAREYSNSDAVYDPNDEYDSRILSTNACSEQYLSRESLCVLASINMEKFSIDSTKYSDELLIIAQSINRFLDNVNEYELREQTYATPHQKLAIEKLRRTGAGITNIAGWLFKNNLEYGTKEANELVDKFLDQYNYCLYYHTIKLGEEKGSFGLFDEKKIVKSRFIKELIAKHPDLKFSSMRNVTVSSIAPTGTLSLMFRNMVMSYGIEPAIGLYYWKRTRISGKYEYYFVVPNIVRKLFEDNGVDLGMKSDTVKDTWDGKIGNKVVKIIEENKDKLKIHFKNATEINSLDKLDMMARAMKSVDSSISTTYMLPENADWKDTYKFILKAYESGVKSLAAFPDRKMYGIISYISFKELATKLQKENVTIHPTNFSDDELEQLNLSKEFIRVSSAPKRPIKLPADVYSITVKGEKFIVAIGLLNGAPYEIFCGKMNGLNFKFQYKQGVIEKVKKGQYKLVIGDDIEIEDFSGYFKPVEAELFRMVSTNMRHGVPIKFIVEQLSKSADDLSSLTSAASRVLKKYITAGEIATGIICPSCGSQVVYDKTGCTSCTSCEWSKC
ncbi:MAG: ribonucleoside-diphosphate reductase, adenosylcobalamin-dependent [Ignavibacteriaceae bacterium]|nr:MAG: ribonucleoside-diphosphate reductase, adenosylcobalamin-dependent [Ignavibacteriaceae bacterium]